MNQELIEKLALEFAKSTKTSKAKALQLAKMVANEASKPASIAARQIAPMPKPARKLSKDSVKLREYVKANKGVSVSAKRLAIDLGLSLSLVNNNLQSLYEQRIISKTEATEAQKQGRHSVIWEL